MRSLRKIPEFFLDLFEYDGYYGLLLKKDIKVHYTLNPNSGSLLFLLVEFYYNKKRQRYPLHRVIYYLVNKDKFDQTKLIDHKDGNTFNNKIENLREATNSQNLANTGPNKLNTSGYKGVSLSKNKKKWRAYISCIGVSGVPAKQISLGHYNTKEEAAEVYNKAALQYFGEFAYQNPIQNSYQPS